MKKILYLLISMFTFSSVFAQHDSIPREKKFISHQVLPLGLITTGALLNIGNIKYKIEDAIPETNNSIDDYIELAPVFQMYLFDAMGIKHQNNIFDQTKYLIITQFVSGMVTQGLKKVTKVNRPTGADNSYPSGHTTLAFASATVLYHEFIGTDPWLAYSGFAFATATGCLRMTNRAHWLPDVLTGAGIGILTGNLVYYFKPLKKLQLSSGKKKMSFIPMAGYKSFSVACTF